MLEEVVVTADRRDSFGAGLVQVGTFRNARIVDVPLTVNVAPQALIQAQGAVSIYDALRNTAGVSRSQLNGAVYDNIAVRGILVENRTSYRLNGSLPIVNLVDLPLENKDRVEVLKGVGALYYGFAPPSGIINLVSKRPVDRLLVGTVQVNAYGAALGHVDASERFFDGRLGVRLNGVYGAVDTGVQRADGERSLASAAIDWRVFDRLTLRLDVEHVHKDVTEPAAIALPAAVNGVITLPPTPASDVNLSGRGLRYDAEAFNYLLRGDFKISDAWALTIEGGVARTERDRDFSQFQNYNLITGNGTLSLSQTRDQIYRNRNYRAELAGVFVTGSLQHSLIVGATRNLRFQNGRSNRATTQAQNFFTPRDVTVTVVDVATLTVTPLKVRDDGAYAVDRIAWGPLQLLAGARYSDYKSEIRSPTNVFTRFALDRISPTVGLIYKPVQRASLYATYLEGLEEGGTAPASAANVGSVLNPAVSEQYEAGLKVEAFTGLLLQLAGFQITRPSAFTDPADNTFKLAGSARYRGVEGSATGELTRDLSVYLSAQWLDAEVTRAISLALEGRRPENTPEWTGSAFVEYRPPALRGLALGGGVFYVGDRAVNNFNQAFVGDYATFSASVRYTFDAFAGRPVTLQLNADNLLNSNYYSAAGNNLLGVGLPRTVKLTFRTSL